VEEGKGAEVELVNLLARLASLELPEERREGLAKALQGLRPALERLAALELEEEPPTAFQPEG